MKRERAMSDAEMRVDAARKGYSEGWIERGAADSIAWIVLPVFAWLPHPLP